MGVHLLRHREPYYRCPPDGMIRPLSSVPSTMATRGFSFDTATFLDDIYENVYNNPLFYAFEDIVETIPRDLRYVVRIDSDRDETTKTLMPIFIVGPERGNESTLRVKVDPVRGDLTFSATPLYRSRDPSPWLGSPSIQEDLRALLAPYVRKPAAFEEARTLRPLAEVSALQRPTEGFNRLPADAEGKIASFLTGTSGPAIEQMKALRKEANRGGKPSRRKTVKRRARLSKTRASRRTYPGRTRRRR